jgi:hypothetical protein
MSFAEWSLLIGVLLLSVMLTSTPLRMASLRSR